MSSVSGILSTQTMYGTERSHQNRFKQLMDASAQYLGLSADDLRTQLQSGKSLADVAKAEGKSVDGLKQALQSVVSSNQTGSTDASGLLDRIINGKPGQQAPPPDGGQAPNGGGGFQQLLQTTASYLGISTDDLQSQLESGKSLADVAKATGKSVGGLKQALQAAMSAPPSDGTSGSGSTSTSASSSTQSTDLSAFLDQIITGHPGKHHHHHGAVQSTGSTNDTTSSGSVNLVA